MANRIVFSGFRPACIADQAAAALREAIKRGAWETVLPSEYELARRLGISRSSLRASMAQLSREGLVDISHGRRSRLRVPRRSHVEAPATVCMIAPVSRDAFHPWEHSQVLQVHARFADRGIGWEEIFDSTLGKKHPEHRLKELVSGRSGVCWLLVLASAPMQRWFEKAGAPVLVLGSCHPGIKLPSVDVDYHAIGWHAAGRIAQVGHRHATFLLPQRPMPGDLACRDGFLDYLTKRKCAISVTEIAMPNAHSPALESLGRLLSRRPRPTVVLSLSPRNTLTIFINLPPAGLRIPDDLSVVACDTHTLLEETMPGLTRYRISSVKLARRVVRVAQSILAGHTASPKPNLIMPKFVRGLTLAGLPKTEVMRPIRLASPDET